MKKMTSAEIRQAFLNYFSAHGHQVVPTSSLVPAQDPTLLFTNAGMVQFKDVFLGTEQRSYQRAVSVQRCVRAGGKHNDLENVGFTARHHTFFEMLGNFSFGDYFKKEAIRMAWDFLTQVLQLPKEKLWVTVYEQDLESEQIWIDDIGVVPDRVIRCGAKDNFWAMGDTGPCGPCTEIYYDHGPGIAGGPPGSPDMEGDRYVEIWNVVFMQFNRDPEGQMHPLPKPSVDTGMGLERIAAVMQGVHSNYDTDIFVHLKQAIIKLAPQLDKASPSLQVIADHIRACAFLLADGVMPSNEGRGYVLRRIIRRAIRHGQKLGLPSPFMHQLVPALIDVMGQAYPELSKQHLSIEMLLKQEEEQFIRTIHQGLKLLQESLQSCKDRLIPGNVVFKLYDTYGFPVDLTADAAREAGYELDMAGFDAAMQQQRSLSQASQAFQSDYLDIPAHLQGTVFHGYDNHEYMAKVQALYHEQQQVSLLESGQTGMVILSSTPFYAESGGQVGDSGILKTTHGQFEVQDTQRKGELFLHIGKMIEGHLMHDEEVHASVDTERRDAIRLNHTATHILHSALRQILGLSVQQKGSLVDAERCRFDFSFQRGLTAKELENIEIWVNAKIRANQPVETHLKSLEEAQSQGAMALFGEKYGEEVRVLTMGDFSQELCGGTHASRTGDIGLFKILSEGSVASGVRRVEFVTGRYALDEMQREKQTLSKIAGFLKTSPQDVFERLQQMQQQMQNLQQQAQQFEKKMMLQYARELIEQQQKTHSKPYLVFKAEGYDMKTLRTLSDLLRDIKPEWAFILYTIEEQQLQMIAAVPKSLQGKIPSAAEWVKSICSKGGGRPDFAQGGGDVPVDLKQRLQAIEQQLNQL
jgi:alanyl-tRNA synthetase